MPARLARRLCRALTAFGLTACSEANDAGALGSAENPPRAPEATSAEHDHERDDHTHADHSHGELQEEEHEHLPIEVELLAEGRQARDASESDAVPAVELLVLKDPVTGWIVHSQLTNFELAPEESSSSHREGRGHLHCYVDGEMVAHVYGEYLYLPDMVPGEHRVRMEVVSNDHRPLALDETILGAVMTVEQPGPDDPVRFHQRHEDTTLNLLGESRPTLTLELHLDPEVGHLLEVQTTGFSLTPLNLSNYHLDGEGHFRLSVDGAERMRVFSPWFQLPWLKPGEHTVTVDLMTNDHRVYTVDGEPIGASVELVTPAPAP